MSIEKLVCISDMHGQLPDIPECDLLLIAGDITPTSSHKIPFQARWLRDTFGPWLQRLPARHIVGVAGNHDYIFQNSKDLVPELKWNYLECSEVVIEGLRIWGTPWSLWFYDWAFNAPKGSGEEFLKNQYLEILNGTDIVVSHGPTFTCGDLTTEGVLTGSRSLVERLQVLKPLLTVVGHIHESYGVYRLPENLTVANASILDEQYRPVNKPIEFTLKRGILVQTNKDL